jgi:hypothetical protein
MTLAASLERRESSFGFRFRQRHPRDTREMMYMEDRALLMTDETSHPVSHYDLVNRAANAVWTLGQPSYLDSDIT